MNTASLAAPPTVARSLCVATDVASTTCSGCHAGSVFVRTVLSIIASIANAKTTPWSLAKGTFDGDSSDY